MRWGRRVYALQPGEADNSDPTISDVAVNTSPSAYTERLARPGVEPSVGSKGDRLRNALAETINGVVQGRELIHRQSWRKSRSSRIAS